MRRVLGVVVCAGALIGATGCGGEGDGPAERAADRLGPTRFDKLAVELANATPQGQVTATQLAGAAPRQAAIAMSYAAKLAAGGCKTGLLALAASYDRLGRASTAAGDGAAGDDAYAAAAGAVSAALQTAEKACR
jgi:hypothetical protein